jgi:hypothetical protein
MAIDVLITEQVLGSCSMTSARAGVLLNVIGLVDLVAENESEVAAVLVADIDLVGESEERPVLRKDGVVVVKQDRRVLRPRVGEVVGERYREVSESTVQFGERGIDDA